MNGDLIACARYRIYDERVKALEKNKIQGRDGTTHVLFIINLPHQVSTSSFVGFQGDPWISTHIDDLRPSYGDTIESLQAISATISELFIGGYINDIWPLLDTVPQYFQQVAQSENEESSLGVMTSSSTPERQLDKVEEESEIAEGDESDEESDMHLGNDEEDQGELALRDHSSEKISAMESLTPQGSDQVIPCSEQPLLYTEQATLQADEPVRQLATVAPTSSGEMEVVDIEEQAEEMEFSVAGSLEVEPLTNAQGTTKAQSAIEEIQQDDTSTQVPQAMYSDEEAHSGEDDIKPLNPELQSVEPVIPGLISASVEYEGDNAMDVVSLDTSEIPKKPRFTINHHPIAQCRRLHGCIQAAASKLEDATKDRSTQRVTHLTKLIPSDPAQHIGNKIEL